MGDMSEQRQQRETDMKTAILSMQRIVNIGSVLQAYSLRGIVKEVTGVEPDFLDIEDEPSLPSLRTVKEMADYQAPAVYSRKLTQRAKRWVIARLSGYTKRMIRRFMQDELCLKAENSQNTYDSVIIGSDEVFNHVKGVRLQLHGKVKQAEHVFTYAASCGSALAGDIAPENVPTVKDAMAGLAAVSVRDQRTQEYAQALYGGPIERHLDPVLTGNLYKRTPRKVPLKKYLLVYAYGQRIRTAEEIDAIQAFARERGLTTVAIGGSQFWCDRYIPVSPFRAMDYFHFADYVVTDTFHGVVFSILHHKKFAAIVRQSNRGKMTALLEDFNLQSRQVDRMADLGSVLSDAIPYDAVDEILCRERERARAYLKKQLRV